jgi:hypothetical protein
MTEKNIFLADIIFVFHCLIILFVLFAPFTQIPAILIIHITFAICLLLHWYTNSNVCSLTVLEANLRGLPRTDTFTHQFIGPIYDISSTDLSNIVHIITYIMMFISIYYLYNTDKFKIAMKCYNELEIPPDATFYQRMKSTLLCFQPLFLI